MFWTDIVLLVLGIVVYTFTVVTVAIFIYSHKRDKKEADAPSRNIENIRTIIGNFRLVETLWRNPDLTDEQNNEGAWNSLDVGMKYTDNRNEHVYEIIDKDYELGTLTVKAVTTFSYLELPNPITVLEPRSETERKKYAQDIRRKANAKTVSRKFD